MNNNALNEYDINKKELDSYIRNKDFKVSSNIFITNEMDYVNDSQATNIKEFKYNEMLYQINKENNLYVERMKKHCNRFDF